MYVHTRTRTFLILTIVGVGIHFRRVFACGLTHAGRELRVGGWANSAVALAAGRWLTAGDAADAIAVWTGAARSSVSGDSKGAWGESDGLVAEGCGMGWQ